MPVVTPNADPLKRNSRINLASSFSYFSAARYFTPAVVRGILQYLDPHLLLYVWRKRYLNLNRMAATTEAALS